MQSLAVQWDDIKWSEGVQVCPAIREDTGRQGHKTGRKTGKDHIIVLSDAAIDLLREMERLQNKNGTKGKYVFPKMGDPTKHMSRGSPNAFYHRYLSNDFPDITLHGFRGTYKSWAIDAGYSEIDSKMTLAHSLGALSELYGRDATRFERATRDDERLGQLLWRQSGDDSRRIKA